MKHAYDHSDYGHTHGHKGDSFFREVEAPFSKSREQAWAEIEARISGQAPAAKTARLFPYKTSLAIAASLILLAGIYSLMRFYSKTIECPAGQHMAVLLPDGSSVSLNAESTLSYHPFWWRFDRQVRFEGEGYFEVQKGKTFEVRSDMGTTQVLGTSFNIFARENVYQVNCITGQVRVISASNQQVVLTPDYMAKVNADGQIEVSKESFTENLSWINSMFNFTSRPLKSVLEEIERQYDVEIILESQPDFIYTGYFSRNRPVEEVLALVCKPFGLTFVKNSEKKYSIVQNREN